MTKLRDKFRVCISITAVVLLVCSLAVVIYLGGKQLETLASLSARADNMQLNIDILRKDLEKRKAAEAAANESAKKLEDQTTEDMKGL